MVVVQSPKSLALGACASLTKRRAALKRAAPSLDAVETAVLNDALDTAAKQTAPRKKKKRRRTIAKPDASVEWQAERAMLAAREAQVIYGMGWMDVARGLGAPVRRVNWRCNVKYPCVRIVCAIYPKSLSTLQPAA